MHAAGRGTRRSNALGQSVSYACDARGQITAKDVDGALTSYEYSTLGAMTRATGPDADILWERDAMGRGLSETVNGRRLTIRYDAAGQRFARTAPVSAVTE
ncbi:hypothetical protein [Streptomyces hoynatensis]|uniref:RHS repeat protein n=1 Tax=Streptomyces hoynatensis TaxID=1141874 RepID=A0A3A9YVK8_9ACTN|nr:hypothetical protein [Streptomyces hoynatensis]RKN39267.1 hypothetical protein D7294_22120 [Streptomyces hoynatensis]